MRILFIPDLRGQGHKVRCAALAKTLWDRGHETDIIGTLDIAIDQRREYQAVVIDVRSDIPMGSAVKHTIRIIDDPECQKGAADLTVLGCASRDRFTVMGTSRAVSGPRYSLLRPEFRTPRYYSPVEEVFDARKAAGLSADSMAVEMANSKVVITYGGMRAMEAACCGAPMVVVPRNRGEHLNARGLAEAGAAVISSDGDALRVAEQLLPCAPVLEKMSRAGRELVDGRGCERVADEIERLCR